MSKMRSEQLVFISHAADADGDIAKALKEWIEQRYESVNVFVSSVPGCISGGKLWESEVLRNLNSANVMIVLLTKESVNQLWVTFEIGFALGRSSNVKIFPVLCKNTPVNEVPSPISSLELYDLTKDGVFENMLSELDRAMKKRRNTSADDNELKKLLNDGIQVPVIFDVVF